jgi:hypothetical protein
VEKQYNILVELVGREDKTLSNPDWQSYATMFREMVPYKDAEKMAEKCERKLKRGSYANLLYLLLVLIPLIGKLKGC